MIAVQAMDFGSPVATFFNESVVEKKRVAALVFFARWCFPGMLQYKEIIPLKKEYDGRVDFIMVDVDEEERMSEHFDVRTLPAVVLFAKGEMVEALSGFQQAEFLKMYLDYLISQCSTPS